MLYQLNSCYKSMQISISPTSQTSISLCGVPPTPQPHTVYLFWYEQRIQVVYNFVGRSVMRRPNRMLCTPTNSKPQINRNCAFDSRHLFFLHGMRSIIIFIECVCRTCGPVMLPISIIVIIHSQPHNLICTNRFWITFACVPCCRIHIPGFYADICMVYYDIVFYDG